MGWGGGMGGGMGVGISGGGQREARGSRDLGEAGGRGHVGICCLYEGSPEPQVVSREGR